MKYVFWAITTSFMTVPALSSERLLYCQKHSDNSTLDADLNDPEFQHETNRSLYIAVEKSGSRTKLIATKIHNPSKVRDWRKVQDAQFDRLSSYPGYKSKNMTIYLHKENNGEYSGVFTFETLSGTKAKQFVVSKMKCELNARGLY